MKWHAAVLQPGIDPAPILSRNRDINVSNTLRRICSADLKCCLHILLYYGDVYSAPGHKALRELLAQDSILRPKLSNLQTITHSSADPTDGCQMSAHARTFNPHE